MKLLLDTCTVLWYFGASDNISQVLKGTLTDIDNEIFISDVSLLEITIKYSLGKLELSDYPSKVIPQWIDEHDMILLPLSSNAIFGLEKLPFIHNDPFDRLLLSQAKLYEMTLVTPDKDISCYSVHVIWK
jgi:PIN domain nuclease of toxin-antitoxin system